MVGCGRDLFLGCISKFTEGVYQVSPRSSEDSPGICWDICSVFSLSKNAIIFHNCSPFLTVLDKDFKPRYFNNLSVYFNIHVFWVQVFWVGNSTAVDNSKTSREQKNNLRLKEGNYMEGKKLDVPFTIKSLPLLQVQYTQYTFISLFKITMTGFKERVCWN